MCKCVPYLIIVCDMGVGVNARGSDGYYATVYRRCFISYGRQYVSYLLYIWRVSFQNEILSLKNAPIQLTRIMIVTLTNEAYVVLYIVYWALFLHNYVVWKNIIYIIFKMDTVFWNETLHFSLFHFLIPEVWAYRLFWECLAKQVPTAWDCRRSGLAASIICHFFTGCHFPL